MQRVLIIGSGGAGKSTFAKRLHEITGLKLIHLDKLFWKPNWTETPKDEWRKINKKILKENEWIIDGNFGSTMEMRIEACDTVIWLDLPPAVCVYRAIKRVFNPYNKNRPDMGEGCREKLDWDFLWWVWTFKRSKSGKKLRALIEKFKDTKNIIRLRSKKEVEDFLRKL